jgi:hypothetical protein
MFDVPMNSTVYSGPSSDYSQLPDDGADHDALGLVPELDHLNQDFH